jgi:protein phosphatase
VGRIREHNEDSFIAEDLTLGGTARSGESVTWRVADRGILLAVCDGMGGAAAGEEASRLAVEIVSRTMKDGAPARDRDEVAARLVDAIRAAGAAIFEHAELDRSRRGMGTTATVAVIWGGDLLVGQIGDSRAYVMRGDRLVQITRDQTLTAQLIEVGQLTEEEAETFEHNNIITQALGPGVDVDVDVTHVELRRGDAIVLCSDGLHGMMPKDAVRSLLIESGEPRVACGRLAERANEGGGVDNITVIVAKVTEGAPDPEAREIDALKLTRLAAAAGNVETIGAEPSSAPAETTDDESTPEQPEPATSKEGTAVASARMLHVALVSVACATIGIVAYRIFF